MTKKRSKSRSKTLYSLYLQGGGVKRRGQARKQKGQKKPNPSNTNSPNSQRKTGSGKKTGSRKKTGIGKKLAGQRTRNDRNQWYGFFPSGSMDTN